MSKALKFRAWDKDCKRMTYQGTPDLETISSFMYHYGDKELMQFTGLHDITKWEDLTEDERTKWTLSGSMPSEWKGKEIYEGDIVVFWQPYVKEWQTRIVQWDHPFAAFGLFLPNNKYCQESDWVKIQEIKVIGNVNQNPELLEINNG